MSGHVKVGGAWKNADSLSVKVGGSWKNADQAWTKVGGVWKEWFSSGDFESIATVSVGAGGASALSFTNIPQTYTHLEIRGILRSNRADLNEHPALRFNGATSGYASHGFVGNGSSAGSSNWGTSYIEFPYAMGANSSASHFAPFIININNFNSTSQKKIAKIFIGNDANGTGHVVMNGGIYDSTSAISSLSISPIYGTLWLQNSSAALYGIRS